LRLGGKKNGPLRRRAAQLEDYFVRGLSRSARLEDRSAQGKHKGDRIYRMDTMFCFSIFRLPAISLARMKVLKTIRLRGGKHTRHRA
jgi:hypothetical protein